jgi:hypothetical protein
MSIIIYHDEYVNIRRGSAEKGAQTTEKTESRAKMYTPDFVPPNRVAARMEMAAQGLEGASQEVARTLGRAGQTRYRSREEF